MSQQLRDAFQALADDAPDLDAVGQEDIWRRARRARRHSVAAGVLAVAVLVASGVVAFAGLASIHEAHPAAPVPYDPDALAIPDQIWMPSPWTPSTADAGPIGPLAAIATAPHRSSWFHTDEDAVFGVSAATGEYRFIDLPDIELDPSFGPAIALSPDGTRIGYWILGHVASPLRQSDVAGFAVYDSVSGRVSRHLVPTRFGLHPAALTWTGDSAALVANFFQDEANTPSGAGGAQPAPALAWTPESDQVVSLGELPADGMSSGLGSTVMAFDDNGDLLTVDTRTSARQRVDLRPGGDVGATYNEGPTRLAYGAGDRRQFSATGVVGVPDLMIATAGAGSSSVWRAHRLDTDSPFTETIGWIDSSHLLVGVWTSSRMRAVARHHLAYVNVVSGEVKTVLELPGRDQANPSLATGLIGKPFVTRSAPPDYRDPRVLAVVALIAASVVALVGLVWLGPGFARRRRAARMQKARL